MTPYNAHQVSTCLEESKAKKLPSASGSAMNAACSATSTQMASNAHCYCKKISQQSCHGQQGLHGSAPKPRLSRVCWAASLEAASALCLSVTW